MHVTDNYMHVMKTLHVTVMLYEFYTHHRKTIAMIWPPFIRRTDTVFTIKQIRNGFLYNIFMDSILLCLGSLAHRTQHGAPLSLCYLPMKDPLKWWNSHE